MKQHTTHPQGRNAHSLNSGTPSFIWLIGAVRRDCQHIAAQIHHIKAESEHEGYGFVWYDHLTGKSCYSPDVAAKSATGRRNPSKQKAIPDAKSVFFCIVATAHPFNTAQIRTVSMVALVGRRSRLPDSFCSGIPTPANVTAISERRNSGGDSLKQKEAAVMATIPTPNTSFIWLIAAVPRNCQNITAKIHHIEAESEHEGYGFIWYDHLTGKSCYSPSVAAKSATGICTPNTLRATQAPKASFFVSIHYAHQISGLARTVSMVALVGLSSDRPVSFVSGSANPANVTANHDICTSGGDSLNTKEAAVMATIPTPNTSFIWLIAAVPRNCQNITAKIHHIEAESEHEARKTLAREHVTFFAGRIRKGVAA